MGKFERKKLLMLGTSTSSVDIVRYAQSEGAYVIVTDYLPTEKSQAKKYADETAMVSTMDIDVLCDLAKEKDIDGIFCGASEANLLSVNAVAGKLGLPCYFTREQWDIMGNKAAFKELCKKYQVPVVPEYNITLESSESDWEKITYPVVVKPVDSSGSRGISICYDKHELKAGIEKALSYSSSKQLLIEKYMTDAEAVIYYYIQDGNPVFISMCDRYTNGEQTGVAQLPTAYIFPSKHIGRFKEKYNQNIMNMIQGAGLRNGTLFIQTFVDSNGTLCVYECGFRLNGAQEHYIVDAVCGVDAKKLMIHYALTGKMWDEDIAEKVDPGLHGKYACKLSPLIRKGVIKKIIGIEDIEKMSTVVKVVLNRHVGDEIAEEHVGTLRQIGYRAFIVEDSLEKLKETIDIIQKTVKYIDDNGESMMLQEYDTNILLSDYC